MQENTKLIGSWDEIGLVIPYNVNQTKTFCPECSEARRNSKDKCLSVNAGKGVANCHHCGVNYVIKKESDYKPMYTPKTYKVPAFQQLPLSRAVIDFFKSREIDAKTLTHFKVTESLSFLPAKDDLKAGNAVCINFNYYYQGKHTNTKFRGIQKRFMLTPDAMLTFYNIDAVLNSEECYIQEGEIDTLTAYQCGVINSISVPNGASKGSMKLEYLDNCIDAFKNKKKIVIATDGDDAGLMLRAELIRRLGAERCWTIEYPSECKDTNDVLLKHGEKAVLSMYENAQQIPLEGVFLDDEIRDRVLNIYHNGFPETAKIGYPEFDKLITWKGGELTIVTGIPGHGKTTFVDQVLVRLAARHKWRIGVFSPENDVAIHSTKLITKFIGYPSVGANRMKEDLLNTGIDFVNEHFYFMKYDEVNTTIDGILSKASELVGRKGINSLVIDPYNYIEHKRPPGLTETEYISEVLTKITSFAKKKYVHVFLIAHPTKMNKEKDTGKYEVPNLYKISGSAHFFNKADNGFTVYLDPDTFTVTVHVQKVKFDYVGEKGACDFYYDRSTGRYILPDTKYESEYQLLSAAQSKLEKGKNEPKQQQFQFVPTSSPDEPPQLTDINQLIPGTSLNYNSLGDPGF